MIDDKIMEYLLKENLKESIEEDVIIETEKILNFKFPSDFRNFILVSNGYEGEIGKEQYLVFWSLEDIIELNEAYGVDEFALGLLLIGSDGAEIAYAYDKRDKSIVKVPFIGMSLDEIEKCGNNLEEFLDHIA